MEYFEIFGLPPRLAIDTGDLERRFHQLSREHHPDYHTTRPPEERERALRMTALLNDAYRTLRDQTRRVEYLLRSHGLEPDRNRVPQSLLAEVFEINEELDEVRSGRERNEDPPALDRRLQELLGSIRAKRSAYDAELEQAVANWDALVEANGSDEERQRGLAGLADIVARSGYLRNLERDIEDEVAD